MNKNVVPNILTVAAIVSPKLEPYAILNDDNIVHVWDAELVRIFSQYFNVPYKLLITSDGEVGTMLSDGNWTGVIGMVQRSEADLAVGGVILFEKGNQAVKFSYPYLFSEVTFMTDKQQPLSTTSALLYPFPYSLWIILIVLLFFISFLLFILVNKKRSYQTLFFMVFGSMLEQAVNIELRKRTARLVLGACLSFLFFLSSSYKALLLSVLTFTLFTGIRDVADLAKSAEKNLITCYTYKGHMITQVLLESDFDSWRHIGECLQINEKRFGDPEAFFIHSPQMKAFFAGKVYLNPYKNQYFISKDAFFNVMYAFPLSKHFGSREILDHLIHRLFATGILQKYANDQELLLELKNPPVDSDVSNIPKELGIRDFKGAFLILFSGYIVASIVLCIEITTKNYFNRSNIRYLHWKELFSGNRRICLPWK